jgi:hypothetical protein
VSTITAKRLHKETQAVLNQVEREKSLLAWDDVMCEVWSAQKRVKPAKRVKNSVLQERQRHRR